jgi:hypothetical protein
MSPDEKKASNINALFATFGSPQKLADKYWNEYGTILCPHIQRRLFGRTWWLLDREELKKFEAQGGHDAPDKCCHVVGNAARWTLEILMEKEVVKVS